MIRQSAYQGACSLELRGQTESPLLTVFKLDMGESVMQEDFLEGS
jgi:hypothetical protein